ncbi:BTAD domain-containing putative transcriptional regulator [Nonomuraea sp. NPDC003707]
MTSQKIFRFGVLGSLDVRRDGGTVVIPAAKQRIILATLLMRNNEFVSRDHLIERIWNGDAPTDARGALHTHVSRLRRLLRDKDELIRGHRGGYILSSAAVGLDLSEFRALTSRASIERDAAKEANLLGRALGLWRGPALTDVPSELMHDLDVPILTEERIVATERLVYLRLRLGRHEETVVPLKVMTGEHPFRERLWAYLMTALFLSGRRGEALDTYRTVVALLREELGIDPGQELVRVHSAILAEDSRLARLLEEVQAEPPPGLETPSQALEQVDLPEPPALIRQLPSDVVFFAGRSRELRMLDDLLVAGDAQPAIEQSSRPIVIAALTGTRLISTGQWLAGHARDLIIGVEAVEAEIARIDGKVHGVLRVGALPTLGYTLLPSALTHLATTAPELDVRVQQLEPEESLAALARGELDVALGGEYSLAPRRGDTNLDRIDLYVEPMFVAVPANHRLRGPHVALADLRDDRWIAPASGTACALVLERACALVGYEPHVIGVCADFTMAAALVGAGNGIALLPAIIAPLIGRFGDTPNARLLTVSSPGIDRTLFAAVRQGTRTHPAIACFLEALRKQLSRSLTATPQPGFLE